MRSIAAFFVILRDIMVYFHRVSARTELGAPRMLVGLPFPSSKQILIPYARLNQENSNFTARTTSAKQH